LAEYSSILHKFNRLAGRIRDILFAAFALELELALKLGLGFG
jgi:hypothetical protein